VTVAVQWDEQRGEDDLRPADDTGAESEESEEGEEGEESEEGEEGEEGEGGEEGEEGEGGEEGAGSEAKSSCLGGTMPSSMQEICLSSEL